MSVSHASFIFNEKESLIMIRKGVIDGKLVDVISQTEYSSNANMYQTGFVAVDINNEYIYPLRGKADDRPGFYPSDCLYKYKNPSPEEAAAYSADNITDFSNPADIGELIDKQQKLKQQERVILTTADNIFKPQVKPTDYPALSALKTATSMKNIDLDLYAHRFDNYNNDRRFYYDKNSISLNKLVSTCQALDISAILTLQDSSPDVPNPMGESISVVLTSGISEEGDEQ